MGLFQIADKVFRYHAGDAIVINESEPHGFVNAPSEESDWTFLFFHPARLLAPGYDPHILDTGNLAGTQFRNLFVAQSDSDITDIVHEMVDELHSTAANARSAFQGLAQTLMARLHRHAVPRSGAPEARTPQMLRRLTPALEHIANRLAAPLSVPALARECHMSESTFRRAFATCMGVPAQAYIHRLRIQMAMSLLRGTDRAILDIALTVGYPTISSFNRQFRDQLRTTPRAYRLSDETRTQQ